jgi:iron-sulfur cluster assembly accessory protein
MLLNFCNKTIKHFKSILKNTNHKRILIGVKGGGCNGLKYYIEPTSDNPNKIDEIIKKDDIEIVVCGQNLFYLIGTNIKWVDNNMGSGLEFNNPNANSSCGCGETFSI